MKSGEARILLGLRFHFRCLVDDPVPRLGVWARVRVQCGDAAWRLRRCRGVRSPAVAGPRRARAGALSLRAWVALAGWAWPGQHPGSAAVAPSFPSPTGPGGDDTGPVAAEVTSPPGSPAEQCSRPAQVALCGPVTQRAVRGHSHCPFLAINQLCDLGRVSES